MIRKGKRIITSSDEDSEAEEVQVRRPIGVSEERASAESERICRKGRNISVAKCDEMGEDVFLAPTMRPPATAVSSEAAGARSASSPSWSSSSSEKMRPPCPITGCDGRGNRNPRFATHSAYSGCPNKQYAFRTENKAVKRFARDYRNARSKAEGNVEMAIRHIPEFDDLHEATKRMFLGELKGISSDTVLSKLYHIYACNEGEEPILLYTGKTSGDKTGMSHFEKWMIWRNTPRSKRIAGKYAEKGSLPIMEAMESCYLEDYKFRLIEGPLLPSKITNMREKIIIRGFNGKPGVANRSMEMSGEIESDILLHGDAAEVAGRIMQATWTTYTGMLKDVPLIDLNVMNNYNWMADYVVGSIKGGAIMSYKEATVTKLLHKHNMQLQCLKCSNVAYSLSSWRGHLRTKHKTCPTKEGLSVQCRMCSLVFATHNTHPHPHYPCTSNRFVLVRPNNDDATQRPIFTATKVFAEDSDVYGSDGDSDSVMVNLDEMMEVQVERDEDQHEGVGSNTMEGDEYSMPTMRLPATAVSSEAVGAHAASSPSWSSSECTLEKRKLNTFPQASIGKRIGKNENVRNGYNSDDEYGMDVKHDNIGTNEERERTVIRILREEMELEVKKMIGDGACLFRSVAEQVYGNPEFHREVRTFCLDHMECNYEKFNSFITEELSAYIARKRPWHIQGNHLDLQAIAEVYDAWIEVYQYDVQIIPVTKKRESEDNNAKQGEDMKISTMQLHEMDEYDDGVNTLSQQLSQTVVSQPEGEDSDEEEEMDDYIDYDEMTLLINGVPVHDI